MVVTDQDSTEVTFAEEEPKIEGGMLLQDSEFEATWRWCPTAEQVRAQDRYLLTLSADDVRHVRQGRTVPAAGVDRTAVLVDTAGALVAIAETVGDRWQPRVVLPDA